MATRRKPPADPDVGRARAGEVRRQAEVQARWFPQRAAWLRRLADGYEQGVLDPVERVHHPADGPVPADLVAQRVALAGWMAADGLPARMPEAFHL